jgi:glyoxylase-like metal-dependent hydrolase (beta-lactamase superfamily II)
LIKAVVSLAAFGALAAAQPAAPPDPLVKENTTLKVSAHVYVIPDGNVPLVPNVGIVVGSRATLVVDTGLGLRNGEAVARETAKISRNAELYIVSTHFHPEHALGENAFPVSAKVIRARTQQQDIDEFGLALANTFSQRSAATRQLLDGAQYRKADVIFDGQYALDLGGVRVQLIALGPTHTRGDTVAFVEGERILFAGDIVMNKTFVAFASPYSSVKAWLAALDRLAPLNPARIVPSHGEMGDATLIAKDRDYLSTIQRRAAELRSQGTSQDATADIVSREMAAKFPDWTNGPRVAVAAKTAFAER